MLRTNRPRATTRTSSASTWTSSSVLCSGRGSSSSATVTPSRSGGGRYRRSRQSYAEPSKSSMRSGQAPSTQQPHCGLSPPSLLPLFHYRLRYQMAMTSCRGLSLGWTTGSCSCFRLTISVCSSARIRSLSLTRSRAFRPDEGPVLLIESINGASRPETMARLEAAARARKDIIIRDAYVSARGEELARSDL